MDWVHQLTVIELGPNIMGFIPGICERTTFRSSDAVHLANSFWMRDLFRLSSKLGPRAKVTFATSDTALGRAAAASNLEVFDPLPHP